MLHNQLDNQVQLPIDICRNEPPFKSQNTPGQTCARKAMLC
jgi:hypothetical protein